MDWFSSLPSLPAPNCLSVAVATHEKQAAMVTVHQRVLNVWEQATTVCEEQAMQELDQWLCRADEVQSPLVHTGALQYNTLEEMSASRRSC